MDYNCLFTNVDVSIFRRSDGSLAFKGILDDKLYLVDFSKENVDLDACLIAKTNMGWFWHRRLAHVDDDVKPTRTSSYGSLRSRCLSQ